MRRRATLCLLFALYVSALAATACDPGSTSRTGPTPVASSADEVFTPAHRTVADAARDFFHVRAVPRQPLPFPHKTHIAKQALCTDCHETVERGPVAGIPSVKTCMICHSQIGATRPSIIQVAAYSQKGIEIPWQRVYGFTREQHVRFNHAPHIRASVDCKTCHGDVSTMTVAERVVDHNMGFCVSCHRRKNAPNDCLTCHF